MTTKPLTLSLPLSLPAAVELSPFTKAAVAVVTLAYIARLLYQLLLRPNALASHTEDPPSLKQADPIFGLDSVIESYRKLREHDFLADVKRRFDTTGNTYVASMLGIRHLTTCEPDNIKAMLATQFEDFALGARRRAAFHPLLGDSIFASDGQTWKDARQKIRPSFNLARISDTAMLERHVCELLRNVKEAQLGGGAVDLQDLFFKLTLDVSTDFFFGESCNSLAADGAADSTALKFAGAFNRSQQTLADGYVMGPIASLLPNPQFRKDRGLILEFIDRYVAEAIEHVKQRQDADMDIPAKSILEHLVGQAAGPVNVAEVRDQALSLLVAGRDTTASLLSSLWCMLSQRPDVWQRLGDEVQALQGAHPDFAQLKDMGYLQNCLREALRLFPPVPVNVRQAVRDTTLPTGGGPAGTDKVFVPAGTTVSYSVYAMHRRTDLWGADAAEFRPERWEGRKAGWEWLPFNGGPRICLGQQLALMEAGYATVRLLQSFGRIAPVDPLKVWREHLTLTLSVDGGVPVRLS